MEFILLYTQTWKGKEPGIQHPRRDILHQGGGLSHQSMKALLLGSTMWHTQYPQKNEPRCLECLVNDDKSSKKKTFSFVFYWAYYAVEQCNYFVQANYKL